MNHDHRIVVLGAGLSGLTAAYDLCRAGFQVTLLEATPDLGGLASSTPIDGYPVERFYHFICRGDRDLINIANQVGVEDQLHWQHTSTSSYVNGHLYPFSTPFDLINFTPVPFWQRIRFGLHVLRSRYRKHWESLDGIAATPWLISNLGEEAYNAIWKPLIQVKFGDYHRQISASWMWHRIYRVARSRKWLLAGESFGYFNNGSYTLVDGLRAALESMPNCTLRLNSPAKKIVIDTGKVKAVHCETSDIPCEAVISTIALQNLDKLLPHLTDPYFENIRSIKMIGVVCMLLSLDRPFSDNFWLNINDPRIPHNGIIELTNLNENLREAGLNILYIPYYLSTSAPRYRATNEELLKENLETLKIINPSFEPGWIKEYVVTRSPHAQAICTTNFSQRIPPTRSPLKGLYLSDSTQFYPEDRTLSAAVRFGRQAATLCMEDLSGT
jgi:protoporphyrinogen oxidase